MSPRLTGYAAALAAVMFAGQVRAQQSQPQGSQGSQANTAAVPPAAATTAPSSSSATPASTAAAAATTAPTAPAPEASAHRRPPPLPWRQTQLLWSVGVTIPTLDRSLLQYPNDKVDTTLSFRPRYVLSPMFQLRGGVSFRYEFTNSDTTTTQNEPRFSDTNLDLYITGIPAIGGRLKIWLAPRLIFPTSPESRASSMIVTPALVLQAATAFEHVLGGDFMILSISSYSHAFYEYSTPGMRTPLPYTPQCYGSGLGGSCGLQLGGSFSPSDTLSWSLILVQSWTHVSPGVYFAMQHMFDYSGRDLGLMSNSPTTIRNNSIFAAWVDFIVNNYLTFEVGYQVYRNILDADGTYGNPFWAPNQDTRVYLQTIVALDQLYDIVSGRARGAGGVIRVRNNAPRGLSTVF